MIRVVSLLPSATEIVCALDGRELLVGVSHECDHPPEVAGLPVLTRAKNLAAATSRDIDRSVRDVMRDALGIYDLDVELLARLAPDVIVTQDLCDVCAVSFDEVRRAVTQVLRPGVRLVNLRPHRLADVLEDVRRVGMALGRRPRADQVVAGLEARIAAIEARSRPLAPRPRVLTVEWLDPVMPGGTWMPELIHLAGGTPLATAPGEKSPTLDREALEALDPEVVLVKPCGFTLERALAERELLPRMLPWERWVACREGRVYVADGNAYFNRPGPRLVESLEILAACTHPGEFAEFARQHAAAVKRITRDGAVQELVAH